MLFSRALQCIVAFLIVWQEFYEAQMNDLIYIYMQISMHVGVTDRNIRNELLQATEPDIFVLLKNSPRESFGQSSLVSLS